MAFVHFRFKYFNNFYSDFVLTMCNFWLARTTGRSFAWYYFVDEPKFTHNVINTTRGSWPLAQERPCRLLQHKFQRSSREKPQVADSETADLDVPW